jgi:hypothetical protein
MPTSSHAERLGLSSLYPGKIYVGGQLASLDLEVGLALGMYVHCRLVTSSRDRSPSNQFALACAHAQVKASSIVLSLHYVTIHLHESFQTVLTPFCGGARRFSGCWRQFVSLSCRRCRSIDCCTPKLQIAAGRRPLSSKMRAAAADA